MRIIGALVAGVLLATPAFAADGLPSELERTAKEQVKREAAISKLRYEDVERAVTTRGDDLVRFVTISTAPVFQWRGAFTDRGRSDSFFRAMINRDSHKIMYQLYQVVTYSGERRDFRMVNLPLAGGLVAREAVQVNSKLVTCNIVCVHEETIAVDLDEQDIVAIASQSAPLYRYRLKARNGLDWTDDIAPAEAKALLATVARWKQDNASQGTSK